MSTKTNSRLASEAMDKKIMELSMSKFSTSSFSSSSSSAKRPRLEVVEDAEVVEEDSEPTADEPKAVGSGKRRRMTPTRMLQGDVKEVPKHVNDVLLAMFHAVNVCREHRTASFEGVAKLLGFHLDNGELTSALQKQIAGDSLYKVDSAQYRKQMLDQFNQAVAPFAPNRMPAKPKKVVRAGKKKDDSLELKTNDELLAILAKRGVHVERSTGSEGTV